MMPGFSTPRLLALLACQVCVYVYLSANTKTQFHTALDHGESGDRLSQLVHAFRNIPRSLGSYILSDSTGCDFGPSNTFKHMSLFGEKKLCALDLVKDFVINPVGTCPEGKLLDYVIIVNSNADNFARRRAIRKTYGQPDIFGNMTSRLVFLLGTDSDTELMTSIQSEAEKYGDIVQGDFHDAYQNLTLKGISGLRWVANHCSNVKYVIKINDAVFLNIFRVRELLFRDIPKNSISCLLIKKDSEETEKDEWWHNEVDTLAIQDYPFDYCSGNFVLLSGDLIGQLLEAARSVPFYWVDDVYMWGMLVTQLHHVTVLPRSDVTQSLQDAQTCFRTLRRKCSISVFYSKQFDALQQYLLWSAFSKSKKV